jgi:hypothetical protein
MELTMRADRPLLISAAFLGVGLWMIFRYGVAGAGISAALPWSNIGFHLNLAENGPGAIAGVALTAIGVLLFVWSIFAALGSLIVGSDENEREFLRIVPSSTPEPRTETVEDSPQAGFAEQRRFL